MIRTAGSFGSDGTATLQARTRHREVTDEGDCGDGSGRGNGRDEAGGAARAAGGVARQALGRALRRWRCVVPVRAAGRAGRRGGERPEPQGASLASLSGANYGDVVVQVHASGFTGDELSWLSTWSDRLGRDRTPSIPGHELAGVVTALSYGTTGLSVGQRVFGLTDWVRDGTLAEYVAVEARNLAPLPGDVDFTEGAALVMPGLTAWQGLFEHGRLRAGQSVLVHGA